MELKLNDLDLLIWDDTEILASKDYVNIQKFAKLEISNYVQLSVHIQFWILIDTSWHSSGVDIILPNLDTKYILSVIFKCANYPFFPRTISFS